MFAIADKIPKGYYIQAAWNPCGGGADEEHLWLTPREGTGKWETYIYKTQCSSSGTIYSSFGYVFITKNPNMTWENSSSETATTPVTWHVGYAEVFDATNVSSSGSSYTMGSGDAYLHALWIPNRYTIKYNGNGATGGSMTSSSHVYDTAKSLTANTFVRDGYEFSGWSTDSSDSAIAKYSDKQSVWNLSATNGATVNLYAQWKKIIPYTESIVTKSVAKLIIDTKVHNITKPYDILIVGYKNNKFVAMKRVPHNEQNSPYTLEGAIDEIKVMVWDGLPTLKPLCDAEEIPCSEWITE